VLSIDTWAQDALAQLSARPGVRRVGVALVEGGGRRLRFTASDRDDLAGVEWCDVDAYDDVPLNAALRDRTLVLGTLDELAARFADYVDGQRSSGALALAAVPVEAAGRPVGGYMLFFDRPQTFDESQRRELERLGEELGEALGRARRGEPRRAATTTGEHGADPTAAPATGVAADHEVSPEHAAVAEARRFLRRTLHDWDVDDETADTAVLCLSELVTNAVIHSHAGCAVRVQLEEGVLRTTVRDSGTSDAAALEQLEDPLRVHGRGLLVVEALASRWGYQLAPESTTVWFELRV
jgi:anti-sigma regulatory factor (Ser/Thr protein kinase)